MVTMVIDRASMGTHNTGMMVIDRASMGTHNTGMMDIVVLGTGIQIMGMMDIVELNMETHITEVTVTDIVGEKRRNY